MARQFGRITGGAQAEDSFEAGDAGSIGFFQSGISNFSPGGDKQLQGRILPGRDNTLSLEDAAYKTSVIPYRDRLSFDKESGDPAYTAWYGLVKGYRFFGRTKNRFLSPQTLKVLGDAITPEQTADPVYDCYSLARASENPAWKALTEKPANAGKNDKAVLARPSSFALFNYHTSIKGAWNTVILTTAYAAWENLRKKLALRTPYGSEPHDKNFAEFLFGDITDPQTGLLATVRQIKLENISVNGFDFSTADNILRGHRVMQVDDQVLAGRYDLFSDETLKILTYQELVDFLVMDGAVPRELVAEACSAMANVPQGRPANTTYSAPAPAAQPMAERVAAQQAAPTQPPTPAAPTPPPAPAPAATAPVVKFWINGPTGVHETTAASIQSAVNLGGNPQIMAYDQVGGWKAATEFGFTPPAPAAPTPPPAPAPAAPAAPLPPAPPAPPAAPQPQAAFPEAAPLPPAPPAPAAGSGDWTPEDEAEFQELNALMGMGKLPPDRLTPFIKLGQRRPAA